MAKWLHTVNFNRINLLYIAHYVSDIRHKNQTQHAMLIHSASLLWCGIINSMQYQFQILIQRTIYHDLYPDCVCDDVLFVELGCRTFFLEECLVVFFKQNDLLFVTNSINMVHLKHNNILIY